MDYILTTSEVIKLCYDILQMGKRNTERASEFAKGTYINYEMQCRACSEVSQPASNFLTEQRSGEKADCVIPNCEEKWIYCFLCSCLQRKWADQSLT